MELEDIIKSTKNIKLLYVEDNQEARETTELILEEFFDEITVAVDGEDGYTKFRDKAFDLIITDINMPKLNGLDMISKIRALDNNISVIVLSAHNEPEFFDNSIQLGIDSYLLKPIDIDSFIDALSKITINSSD
jgi:YesN/AraC family two-component response regulator